MKGNWRSVLLFSVVFLAQACGANLKEEDKVFHAGPNMSGFGGTFFGLYKNNIYEFCDGDFMDPGCYTGEYELNENILTLKNIRISDRVKNNRFIIYRYAEQDSSYWLKKYPDSSFDWRQLKEGDIGIGSEGDVYELDKNNNPTTYGSYYYIIRMDKLNSK